MISPQAKSQISVIIPVHNGARYLAETIESVLNQQSLSANGSELELIVIDDGSTDGSADIAQKFDSVHYYYQTNAGAAAARNLGVRQSGGGILAFLDADDLWLPQKLSRQMQVIEAQPDVDMVFAQVQQFHSPELSPAQRQKIACPAEPMAGYLPSALLIRRDAFEAVGPFETQWKIGEFVSWYTRAQELALRAEMVPEALVKRRLHSQNSGITQRASRPDFARILKASLDRRRDQAQSTPSRD